MSADDVENLIDDAKSNSSLRLRLSQDRTAQEMAESANKQGYSISSREAKKILAGAYLNSDEVPQKKKEQLVGGLSWNYLEKIENELDGDYRFLEKREAWLRTSEFYDFVYAPLVDSKQKQKR